ncbi:hypothetical protein [Marivita sp. GX14005]|uniref:hypothetical protein n=1 Tax=Marivita sp. GX14005 TaxID=2942276 RepID=UPI0020187363|nr:hypothetical protein [Marivita sp. GX14005]MCL3881948.1 hypothetical protein [Marivita sp. GX14005]
MSFESSIPQLLVAASMTLLAALPAGAEERGAVTLMVDGKEMQLPLNASQSDWSGSESYASVSISARPADDPTGEQIKSLSLGFDFANGTASLPELYLLRAGEGDALVRLFGNEEDGKLTVQVSRSVVEGPFLAIEGSFSGAVGPSEDYGRTVDLSDPADVSGSFNVVLGPVE